MRDDKMKKEKKVVGIQSKPEVDLDKLDKLAQEEEEKVDETAKKLEEGEKESEEEVVEETPESLETPETPPAPEVPVIDYETKYKESQKEAMVLKAKIDQIEEEKNKKIDINDAYLEAKYPDWLDLTVGEQKAIRKAEQLEQEIQEIKNTTNQYNNDRKWQEKVELFVEEDLADLFPKIVGREEEFKRFATRPTRKGLPLDDLAKIFLFENPAPEPKRTLFHAPGSKGTTPKEDEGMSADEIRELRIHQPLKYMSLIRQGKLKIKV